MAKKKGRTPVTGVGHVTVTTKVRAGVETRCYTTRFGFAGSYIPNELKKMADELKGICLKDVARDNVDAERITCSARIFYSECQYILSPYAAGGE